MRRLPPLRGRNGLALLCNGDAAERQHQGGRVEDLQVLADDEYRQDRAEDRDEVDEQARAVRPDALDALDVEDLGEQRGKEGGIENYRPAPDRKGISLNSSH